MNKKNNPENVQNRPNTPRRIQDTTEDSKPGLSTDNFDLEPNYASPHSVGVSNDDANQVELELKKQELKKTQDNLQDARDSYYDLYHQAPIGYAALDRHGLIHKPNKKLLKLFKIDTENNPAHVHKLHDFVHSDFRPYLNSHYQSFFNNPDDTEIVLKLSDAVGGNTYISITGRKIEYQAEKTGTQKDLVQVAVTDVSLHKQNEIDLELAAKVFDNSVEAIMITDHQGTIIKVNNAFCAVTGYDPDELRGKTPAILMSGKHDKTFYQDMWDILSRNGQWKGQITNKRKNGEIYQEWLNIHAVMTSDGTVSNYIGIYSDITDYKAKDADHTQIAYHDALTNLPNRALFNDRLKQAIIRARRNDTAAALLFIDLDNFKELNDGFGHAKGDLLLQQVAKRLTSVIRKTDTVCRIGGDEFTIILTDLNDPKTVQQTVDEISFKVLKELYQPFDLDGLDYRISASIGIAVYPDDGAVISKLIQHADTAMYQAKSSGKNAVRYFSKEIFQAQNEKAALKRDLANALDLEQFEVYYQPIITAQTSRVHAFEALLRWNHPTKGLLNPSAFITTLEETGMIKDTGLWVIHQAIKQIKAWNAAVHMHISVCVNLSIVQLQDHELDQKIAALLAMEDVSPHHLALEITETAILKDRTGTIVTLNKIHDLGVRISLDDFGTGFSSMTYIKYFPFDTLKIDRSFVRDILQSNEDKAIVAAILSLAKNLHVKTVAEGVETEEQKLLLREIGCSSIQGFLIEKPLKQTEATAFLVSSAVQ